jgi:hypothetical protein
VAAWRPGLAAQPEQRPAPRDAAPSSHGAKAQPRAADAERCAAHPLLHPSVVALDDVVHAPVGVLPPSDVQAVGERGHGSACSMGAQQRWAKTAAVAATGRCGRRTRVQGTTAASPLIPQPSSPLCRPYTGAEAWRRPSFSRPLGHEASALRTCTHAHAPVRPRPARARAHLPPPLPPPLSLERGTDIGASGLHTPSRGSRASTLASLVRCGSGVTPPTAMMRPPSTPAWVGRIQVRASASARLARRRRGKQTYGRACTREQLGRDAADRDDAPAQHARLLARGGARARARVRVRGPQRGSGRRRGSAKARAGRPRYVIGLACRSRSRATGRADRPCGCGGEGCGGEG